MVELYGLRTDYEQHRIGGDFEPVEVRVLVATFDDERSAKEYVKYSELAGARNDDGWKTYNVWRKQFRYRANSVLRYYTDFEIVASESVSVPHNPRLL